jgi:low temperature requirement protein LtrA
MAENVSDNVRPKSRPRLLTLDADRGERHASWLELFFDLVFVLAVAQVAQVLVKNSDLSGAVHFAVLFVPVWWSWIGFTFYADRFESNETAYRILTFAGMLAVAALSLTLGKAFTPEGDLPLVITYCLVRLVIVALYVRSAYYVPLARGLSLQFIVGFGSAIVIFLLSLLVAPPVRYYVWIAAMVVELATPFLSLRLSRLIPYDYSHIPERFGLFTIIVLGEAVIATATGAASVSWTAATIAMASIGFAMAACVWWINFEFVEDDAIRSPSLGPRFVYLYSHYFIVASIVALGVGVEHAIKETADGHLHLPSLALLGGGIATFLAATTVVKLAAGVCRFLFIRIVTIAVALSMIFLGQFLPPLVVAGIFLLLLVSGVWIEGRFGEVRERAEVSALVPCEHSELATVTTPSTTDGCEECIKNNYKWVHLRLCMECGHVGCCDSSRYKHATKHYNTTEHAIMASLERGESWAWCYEDERFVPLPRKVGQARTES